jgi:hypothetical protein
MINYLGNIYLDPYSAANARRKFWKLKMKANESFSLFYTSFLHLAGQGKIPMKD